MTAVWMRSQSITALLALAFACCAPAWGMEKQALRIELGASAAFGADGVLRAVVKRGEHVLLYRSQDEGATWGAPTVVNSVAERIAADGENRPKIIHAQDGAVLVSWTRPLTKPYSGEIRLARSEDGGAGFGPPITVHRDRSEVTHRFDALATSGDGRVLAAWIDKRDLEAALTENRPYRGAAVYAAVSEDGGRSFLPEAKVADHSCECCRIALARDADGSVLALWRHVFEPNERDHALARLSPAGAAGPVARATFDRWQVDACPHHGPALAVDERGVRHAVWFSQREGRGAVFYGRLADGAVEGQRELPDERAEHADLAVAGSHVALLWKSFDGERTRLRAWISPDRGDAWRLLEVAATEGAADQPRALASGGRLFAFWHTEREGLRVVELR